MKHGAYTPILMSHAVKRKCEGFRLSAMAILQAGDSDTHPQTKEQMIDHW